MSLNQNIISICFSKAQIFFTELLPSFFTAFASLIEFAVINFITVYINRFKAAEEKQREDEKARIEMLRVGELKRLLEAEAAR